MDEEFLAKLKSISAKDVLTDQRPATSRLRLGSSRGGRGSHLQPVVPSNKPVAPIRTNDEVEDASEPIQTIAELLRKQPSVNAAEAYDDAVIGVDDVFSKSKLSNQTELGSFRRPRVPTGAGKRVPTASGNNITGTGNRNPKASTIAFIQEESSSQYIPDLSQMEAEEYSRTIASAPEMEAERITSLRELDADLARLHTFSMVRGVDMRKLSRFMLPEKKLVLYSDQEEDMRHTTYEQLYSDLLPLINGKKLISFDFSSVKGQKALAGFETGIFPSFSQKDGKKKTLDSQMLTKLRDYATASLERFRKKQEPVAGGGGHNLAHLETLLKKAREKYEQKEQIAPEKKVKPPF